MVNCMNMLEQQIGREKESEKSHISSAELTETEMQPEKILRFVLDFPLEFCTNLMD